MSDQPKPDYWGNPEAAFKAGLEQGQAETAAMLEKAAKHAAVFHQGEWYVACVCGWKSDECNEYSFYPKFKEHMLSLIPTDYAAALAERLNEARAEARRDAVEVCRSAIIGYAESTETILQSELEEVFDGLATSGGEGRSE